CGVAPRITQPSAISALKRRVAASFLIASGVSKAPGTRITSMSLGVTPCLVSVSTAASTSRSTMKSLKRDATIPNLKPRALKSPSSDLIRSSILIVRSKFAGGVLCRKVFHDLEAEAGKRMHVPRGAEHAHAADAERAQYLRADAERAEIHRTVALRRGRSGAAQRADRLHEVARGLLGPQQHDDAVVLLGDQPERILERAVQRRVANTDHVAKRVLTVHTHERRRLRIDSAAHERDVHSAVHVILEADHPESAEL